MDKNQVVRVASAFASRFGINEDRVIAVAEEWHQGNRHGEQCDSASLEQFLSASASNGSLRQCRSTGMSSAKPITPIDWKACDRRYDEAMAHLFYQRHVWKPARMAEVERMHREAQEARKISKR